MSENLELIKEFLVESYENLDRLDRDLVGLEKKPDDRETLSSIFRTIHTIKGTCGFLGFTKLESVTHVGENLLSRLRDGELKLNAERTSAMLAMVDATRQILGNIEQTGVEGDADYSDLVHALERLNKGELGVFGVIPSPEAAAAPVAPVGSAAKPTEADPIGGPEVIDPLIEASLNAGLNSGGQIDVMALSDEAAHTPPQKFPKPEPLVVDGKQVTGKVAVRDGAVTPVAAVPAAGAATPAPAVSAPQGGEGETKTAAATTSVADAAIRVHVNLLDKLMNLVGELVLARNQILQYTAGTENATLNATTQRLNLITTELQEGVMKTRMQPINVVWQKLPRVVRDLSTQFGKQIRIEFEGQETELDKTIIEAIKDPLTHVVRNSIDHGIETPAKRTAAGKSAEGVLKLRAFHEGGQVNIEIIDDGAGINPEKVKAKAIEKGLITAEQAARMGEREAVNLIFLPGFSTAEKVTNVSGRGVGMDVVKTNIEKIGGTVDVQTRPGQGTTLRIKIPLTLAIVPALLVTSGGERFAIPQVSLLELVRLDGEAVTKQVEYIHGAAVYRLRGNLLPLARLNEQLRLPEPAAGTAVNIVVLQADGRQFGLVVDEINDTEEIVVKPLGKQLKGISSFAGATIMGDGKVALILDVMGLAQGANLVEQHRDQRVGSGRSTEAATDEEAEKQTLLLCRVGKRRRMAVPLSRVSRLEEFDASTIETEGDTEVVQYRGQIMPLVRLSELFPDPVSASNETEVAATTVTEGENKNHLHAVVFTHEGRTTGVLVDAILDIADTVVKLETRHARPGVLGSAVVQGKVTELLDVEAVVTGKVATHVGLRHAEPALAA